MSSNDSPFPQAGDSDEFMRSKLDAMQAAISRGDGAGVLAELKHIAAENSVELANEMLAALVQHGISLLLAGVRAGDPESVAHAQRLLIQ